MSGLALLVNEKLAIFFQISFGGEVAFKVEVCSVVTVFLNYSPLRRAFFKPSFHFASAIALCIQNAIEILYFVPFFINSCFSLQHSFGYATKRA